MILQQREKTLSETFQSILVLELEIKLVITLVNYSTFALSYLCEHIQVVEFREFSTRTRQDATFIWQYTETVT